MSDPTSNPSGETTPNETAPYGSEAVRRAREVLDAVPDRIGHFRILERIGGGGMGDVFVAEQTAPIKRRVALKIIKAGMDTRQVVARFEAERQALAMMDHPNIAKVFDAGATDTGRPYFVMELVRGVPITQFCDEAKLSTRQRIELLIPVCQAVQHAHQKGIIHRDLKPTNVLVTLHDGQPVPKVIDFGIAKATSQPLTDKTVYTEFRQMIGTPAYMSPEQAEMSGLDIDTRSDIYSLGVLMYELLTGTTPFDTTRLVKAGLGEIQRIIKEEEPPRPSLRISTMGQTLPSVAAQRGIEPARLGKLLAGELDWMVMKALEKDRKRRYDTASDLAADLQRHIAGEPIVAAPPSKMYRARKFVRKYRKSVVAVGAVVIALALGIGMTTWQLIRAEKALKSSRDMASNVQETLETVTKALIDDETALQATTQPVLLFESATHGGDGDRLDGFLRVELDHRDGKKEIRTTATPGMSDEARAGYSANGLQFLALEAIKKEKAERDGTLKAKDAAETEAYIANLALGQAAMQAERWPEARQRLDTCPEFKRGWEWKYLRNLAQTVRFTLPNKVDQVTPSPDGTRLVSRNGYEEWQLWNSQTGERVGGPLTIDGKVPEGVQFIPGKPLVVGSTLNKPNSLFMPVRLQVWDSRSGEPVGTSVSIGAYKDAELSPDGRQIAVANDGVIQMFDTQSGLQIGKAIHPDYPVYEISFAPNSMIGCTHLEDGYLDFVQFWDTRTAESKSPRIPFQTAFAVNADGTLVVTSDHDGTHRVSNLLTGQVISTARLEEHQSGNLLFAPDSSFFVAEAWRLVQMRDVASGKLIGEPVQVNGVTGISISSDGSLVATGKGLWEMRTSRPLAVARDLHWDGYLNPQFIPGQRALALLSDFQPDLMPNPIRAHVVEIENYDSPSLVVREEPQLEAKLLLTTPATHASVSSTSSVTTRPSQVMAARVIAAISNGSRLATAGDDHSIRFWDTTTWRELVAIPTKSAVKQLRFTPDGTRLIVDLADGSMEVWDAGDYAERQKDRDARFAEIPAAKEHVRKLLASDIPTDKLKDFVRTDAGLSTRRKLVALECLDPELKNLEIKSNRTYARLIDGYVQPVDAREAAAKIEEPRVRKAVLARLDRFNGDAAQISRNAWRLAIHPYEDQTDYAKAVELGKKAVAIEETHYTLNALGTALYRTGEYEKAIKALRRADELWVADGNAPGVYNWAFIAMAYQKQTRADEALAALATMEAVPPDQGRNLDLRIEATLTVAPDRVATKYTANNEWTARELNIDAWILVESPGRSTDAYRFAVRLAELALPGDPQSPFILNTLAVAQFRAGDYATALKTLAQSDAMIRDPKSHLVWENRLIAAMAYFQSGERQKANTALHEALVGLQGNEDAGVRRFINEAAALIDPASTQPTKEPSTRP